MARSKNKRKRPLIINDKYLTTDGLEQQMWKMPKSTQAKYRKEMGMPYKKTGGTIYYLITELEAWFDKHAFNCDVA